MRDSEVLTIVSTSQALFVDSDTILGFIWALSSDVSSGRLSPRMKIDLLGRLTAMPFWLNHGGKFRAREDSGGQVEDHWSESKQILWAVGGYLIGTQFP